jgi:hypothetical protein
VLAAGELGYGINKAIAYIEMADGSLGQSVDRKMMLRSQGVTFGPIFSRDIETASHEFAQSFMRDRGSLEGHESKEFRSKVVELARAAGADIGKWFRARVFDAVSGSIAEAIVSHRPFHEIWNGYEAESDGMGVAQDAAAAEIAAEEVVVTMERMAAVSAYLMDKPEVWAAVLALANKLPVIGRMDGDKAVSIIARAIPETDLTGMFTDALERVLEMEREIDAATIVCAALPDGSYPVIKGRKLIHSLRTEDKHMVEVLPYKCNFPVYGETLCRAFGDGAVSKDADAAAPDARDYSREERWSP